MNTVTVITDDGRNPKFYKWDCPHCEEENVEEPESNKPRLCVDDEVICDRCWHSFHVAEVVDEDEILGGMR